MGAVPYEMNLMDDETFQAEITAMINDLGGADTPEATKYVEALRYLNDLVKLSKKQTDVIVSKRGQVVISGPRRMPRLTICSQTDLHSTPQFEPYRRRSKTVAGSRYNLGTGGSV